MVLSTLQEIRTKVRRLTARPSTQQITDSQINEYINTFFLYDMPETLRLFSLHTTFEFMTTANIDQYDLKKIKIIVEGVEYLAVDYYYNISPPVFIAGYQSFWSQDREQFFRTYPELAEIQFDLQGNGTPGPYTFRLSNSPILQFQVTVGTIDDTETPINVIDVPQSRTTGNWEKINEEISVVGSIDYLTGEGTITFSNNIPFQEEITVTAVPYQPNRSQAILFYDNIITIRPVPDKAYLVRMNAFRLPTEILKDSKNQNPELKQWWQYLAYGAAKKIFQDSGDIPGVEQIMPEFNEQEKMVLRRTIVQQTNERTATIYTEMTSFPYGNFQGRF